MWTLSENHVGLLNTCVTPRRRGETIHHTVPLVTRLSSVPCIALHVARA
jgi:hypothetical protein